MFHAICFNNSHLYKIKMEPDFYLFKKFPKASTQMIPKWEGCFSKRRAADGHIEGIEIKPVSKWR